MSRPFKIIPNYGSTQKEIRNLLDAFQKKDWHLVETKARKFTDRYPKHQLGWKLLGVALAELGKVQQALEPMQRAIDLMPTDSGAHNNLGNLYRATGMLEMAEACFREAIKLKPQFAQYHSNLGNVLQELNRYSEALATYDYALNLNSDFADIHNNRGVALYELKLFEEALKEFDQALKIAPSYSEAHFNRGNTLVDLGFLLAAVTSYEAASHIKFDVRSEIQVIHTKLKMCDWSKLKERISPVIDHIGDAQKAISPFPLLAFLEQPTLHLKAALTFVNRKFPVSDPEILTTFRKSHSKIRIAYLSADFHNHATSHLMAELFERHSRNIFEVIAISFGPTHEDSMRKRLSLAFDRFIDVHKESDLKVSQLCRELEIDIAIDLKGYTQYSRPGILARRCAPLQINWLGYPGTMGAPFIDYIVADRTIIEEEDLEYYSEKIIWMPHSYQVNDGKRLVSTRVFTRKECELPEFGFVFCCFNNSYKILPETFNAWMRILKQVDGSILWLFEGHPDAPHNLRNEAAARGIDPNRLIFAKKLDPAEHLARHRLADLFIDTWPYNAHTTASDALWTGLPVITLKGLSFASRVAASLLNAVGMSELITESIEQYEELAVSLALDPNRLLELKQRLKVNLLTEPLFDCERFTRNLESAYQDVMTNYLNKQSPSNIYVIDIADSKAKETATASNLSQVVRTNMSKHSKVNQEVKAIEQVVDLNKQIEVLDVGAACIAEEPVYRRLIIRKSAHLHAFEGDERQITKIRKAYGDNVTIHRTFLYDGSEQTAYIAAEESGMTSLLPPKLAALKFFNGFEHFGTVHSKQKVQTSRLDDIPNLPSIDFVKMDIQGAELTVLKNAEKALSQCIAIQLEVSYIPLYEGQPCFGEIDIWMRSKGFVPHLLMDVKRWSIAPTIRNNDIRVPFNQLLESDIVYIRDPLEVEKWDIQQIKKLAVIAHECFASIDLTIYLLNELIRRNPALASLRQDYLLLANAPRAR